MSLNDEVIEDLPKDTLVDDEIIHSPSLTKPNDNKTIITVKSKDVTDEVTQLSESDMQTLLDTDVKFKIITDKSSKITDLQEVESTIIANESIDRTSAELVNEYFGDLTSRVTLEEFTKFKSKTNYNITVNYMKNTIAIEEEQVAKDFHEFILSTMNSNKQVLLVVRDIYLPDFMKRLDYISFHANKVLTEIVENKNRIVPYMSNDEVQFIDITTLDIDSLDLNNLKLDGLDIGNTQYNITNIRSVLSNTITRTLLFLSIDKETIEFPFKPEDIANYSQRPVTVLDLAKFLNSPQLKAYIESFNTKANDAIAYVDELNGLITDDYSINKCKTILTEQGTNISKYISSGLSLANTMVNVGQIAFNAKALFDLLLKI